jgi:hypothetical protein
MWYFFVSDLNIWAASWCRDAWEEKNWPPAIRPISKHIQAKKGEGERLAEGRHDTQHNDTQHEGISCNIQHNNTMPLCWMSLFWLSHFIYYNGECHYAECRYAECHYAECRGAIRGTGGYSQNLTIKLRSFLSLGCLNYIKTAQNVQTTLVICRKYPVNDCKKFLSSFVNNHSVSYVSKLFCGFKFTLCRSKLVGLTSANTTSLV